MSPSRPVYWLDALVFPRSKKEKPVSVLVLPLLVAISDQLPSLGLEGDVYMRDVVSCMMLGKLGELAWIEVFEERLVIIFKHIEIIYIHHQGIRGMDSQEREERPG